MMQAVQAALGDPYLRKEVLAQMYALKKRKRLLTQLESPEGAEGADTGPFGQVRPRAVVAEWRRNVPRRNASLETEALQHKTERNQAI
jgi:hypothetical protein